LIREAFNKGYDLVRVVRYDGLSPLLPGNDRYNLVLGMLANLMALGIRKAGNKPSLH
jgi:hypothetical protein